MMDQSQKLVMMANQIAAFFASQGEAKAVPAIADHLRRFWDPEMRRRFFTLAGDETLNPLAREAARLLQDPRAR